jgi:two-component system phosphate regulon response regulator OmpR
VVLLTDRPVRGTNLRVDVGSDPEQACVPPHARDHSVESSIVGDDAPIPNVGLVTVTTESSQPIEHLIGRLGWNLRYVSAGDLADPHAVPFDVIALHCDVIDPVVVELAAVASREPTVLVFVIGKDRRPQQIADLFNIGIADYLPEPFDPEEFLVRMQALIASSRARGVRQSGEQVVVDVVARSIIVDARAVSFSAQEWHVLSLLMESGTQPLSAAQLTDATGGNAADPARIAVIISRIRSKLRKHDIEAIDVAAVRGQGYVVRFRAARDT